MTEPSLATLIDTGDEIEIQGHDKWSAFLIVASSYAQHLAYKIVLQTD